MIFTLDERPSNSPLVETIWRPQIGQPSSLTSFTSIAVSRWEMVITRQRGTTTLQMRGPETKATHAPIPEDAECMGITFRHGTYMPHLPVSELVDNPINLPAAISQSFWLHGSAWQFPDFDNADTFVERLVRQGLLVGEPIVEAALQGQLQDLSQRSVQRRFLRATGLTHGMLLQIERARQAMAFLEQGIPILDTVEQLGYSDQPHLTRMLKRLVGQTPAQILRGSDAVASKTSPEGTSQ